MGVNSVNRSDARDQATLIYRFFSENEKALLLILDACNWRVLSSLRPKWEIDVVTSRGSSTEDWLQRTFTKPLKDVVYISSNPFTYVLKDVRRNFKRVIDLPLLAWNERLNTVHPRTVNMFVKENFIAGEKKILAHYLQPHAPFLGDTWLNQYSHDVRKGIKEMKIYHMARRIPNARKEFVRAYIQNLSIVLRYTENLIKFVKNFKDIKVIITSDHSEILRGRYNPFNKFRKKLWLWIPWILGMFRFVGHESNSKLWELYKVPWVVVS